MGPSPVVRLDDALRGVTLLGFDTPPLIYYVEHHTVFGPIAREVFQWIAEGRLEGRTSILSLTEVLVYPKRLRDQVQEESYKALMLRAMHFLTLPVDEAIAERAADLRARHNLRTPDAIQIATALEAGCEAFLTNDLTLRRVTDLRVLALGTLAR